MPFMQFIGSLIAVTIVALIAARLFPNKSKLTKERVISNVSRYCPHIDFGSETPTVYLSETGDTAVQIFPHRHDGFAIATALGDRVVVREIADASTATITETDTGLSLDLDDFTQPAINMQLQPDERRSLLAKLQSQPFEKSEPAHA